MAERRYGEWAGNPKGRAEDPKCCIERVGFGDIWCPGGRQCARKRGFGPDGLYCKQHAKKGPRHAD